MEGLGRDRRVDIRGRRDWSVACGKGGVLSDALRLLRAEVGGGEDEDIRDVKS